MNGGDTYTDALLRRAERAAAAFRIDGPAVDVTVLGSGMINRTFCVRTADRRYVLQIVNTAIFRQPENVMHNIVAVTDHIRRKLTQSGRDAVRGTMTPVASVADASRFYFTEPDGTFWRMFDFVEDTVCRETAKDPVSFELVGYAFGEFQRNLADFDASTLYESIPNFHNTASRYNDFLRAIEENRAGRVDECRSEIEFITARKDVCSSIVNRLKDGRLPLRVTHNDTKMSNILLDKDSGRAVCVIDLDTVMPGSVLYDFGDAIRSGACTTPEDEPDTSAVALDLGMFSAFARGFIRGTGDMLTPPERELLPLGALVITLEQAMRFLTDRLNGDTYYQIKYPEHNLVRTRAQIAMVKSIEANADRMNEIIRGTATEDN